MNLDQTRVKELFKYDPETGKFTRLVTINWRAKAGEKAGWLTEDGYVRISIQSRQYFAHRLAWLYMTGEWPHHQVDHKNGKRDDNRWDNLRSATQHQNAANSGLSRRNTSGIKGVTFSAGRRKCWHARITVKTLLDDPEVKEWVDTMQAAALLPLKRTETSQ